MLEFMLFPSIISLVVLFGFLVLFLWIWALIDCLSSNKDPIEKIMWCLIIISFNVIGSIIYFLLADKKVDLKMDKEKRLTRLKNDKIIAGVCSGIAKYFDIDPSLVRILWVIFTLVTNGVGFFLYVICAIIIPQEN